VINVHKKNKRIRIKIEKLVKQKHYDNMILLLGYLQNRADGLRQKHFRYALMNNENEQLYSTLDMEIFFEKMDLPNWRRMGWLKKGSISKQKDLNYYLKYLLKNNVIEKVNRKKPFRYKLTPEFYSEYNKMEIGWRIDRWDSDNNFKRKYFFKKHVPSENIKDMPLGSEGIVEWTIFGLPRELDKMFTKDEINDITTQLKRVEESLWKIIELKLKKTGATMEERVKTATTIGEKIKQQIDNEELASIDFWYHGKLLPEYND